MSSTQILGEVVLDTQVGAVKDFTQDKPNPIVKAITYWPKRGTIVRGQHSFQSELSEC